MPLAAKVGILKLLLIALAYVAWAIFNLRRDEVLYFTSMTPYWVRQWITRRFGSPTGHCPHCGYNLHANQSGTCPECGNPATPVVPLRESELPPRHWRHVVLTTAAATMLLLILVVVIITR